MAAAALDDVDRRLLHRLAEDAPPDLSKIAAEIGTSAADAAQRYDRLRQAGVITECVARIDPRSVGLGVTAFLLVWITPSGQHTSVVRQLLADLEAVEEAHAVHGDFDWLLKVRVAAPAELDLLVTERLPLVPGFLRAQVCPVIDSAGERVNADRVRLIGR